MSSTVNDVFNFSPSSGSSLKTTSYTIPNGFFARVFLFFATPETSGTKGTITINGTSVLENITCVGNNISVPYTSLCYCLTTASTSFGYTTDYSGIADTTAMGSTYAVNYQAPNNLEIWLKAGDVINGNGNWRALVSLFVNQNSTISGFKKFNYAPSQTVIASSAYTIPAGKYALVKLYFLTQTYSANGMANYPSVNTLTVNGAIQQYIDNKTSYLYNYYYDSKNSVYVTEDYRLKNKNYKRNVNAPEVLELNLKAGDVVSGSGNWRAVVSLYDIAT